jgi:signal transduction histidine kinase
MEDRFKILTATSGEEAVRILQEQDVAVLLADQRMPGMTGVEVCVKARELRPNAIRIIVTAYADLNAAVEAINKGQVMRYMTKPWRNEEIADILRTSIELVHLQRNIREMEMRLLQGGPTTTVISVQQELAHEFHHPLASLVINSQLVSDLLVSALASLDQDNKEHLRSMLSNALEGHQDGMAAITQIRAMVARLRQGRRPSAAPAAKCDAARVVDSTVRILRREIEKVARLQVVIEGSPLVGMDASALGQVMLNLLLNAAQAMGESGSDSNLITVKVQEGPKEAEIAVSDSGPGIAPEHLGRVFDPYFTTKAGNTGIGLSVAQDLIGQAGGRVTAESVLGRGATFKITLPRIDPAESEN